MVRPMPIHVSESLSISTVSVAIGLFVSATILVALCAKHARQKKLTSKASSGDQEQPNSNTHHHKKLLQSPKKLIAIISNKALLFQAKKQQGSPQESDNDIDNIMSMEEDGGLWQKAILMGEKCQPPEFSGVIYYDYSGNRISEMPKSPRVSPMSPLRNFTFPVVKG